MKPIPADPAPAYRGSAGARAVEHLDCRAQMTELGHLVVTQLLQVGLSLQTVRPLLSEPGLQALNDAVDGLDRLIQTMRETVFATSHQPGAAPLPGDGSNSATGVHEGAMTS